MDEERYASLIHYHISNGTKGLVPAGTTIESPTLDHDEHKKVIEIAIKGQMEKFQLLPELVLIPHLKQLNCQSTPKMQEQTLF